MDYQSALDYILSFADYERIPRSALVFDLGRIEMLLERLGNPQEATRSIHIAGTKGKGSTAAMIASILTRAGYRAGLYTSPHLHSFTERIQVNGKPIAEGAFGRLLEKIKPEVEAVNRSGALGELTTFELLTALAFVYFKERRADYQVLETGLGGRLDATNVVKPKVCVITSISFDHMDVLGNTLTQIATEKAGIIKSGSTVVCSPQFPETMAVIERICQERGTRLVRVGSDVTWHQKTFSPEGQSFVLKGLRGEYDLNLPLLGEHQLENAATAVATVEVLANSEARVSPESITAGLAQVHWLGRLQILRREPWVIVDSAHNADSARRLTEALEQYFNFDQLLLIFGVSSDKNIAGMIAELASLPSMVIVTRSHHPRAVEPAKLAGEFSKWGIITEVAEDVGSAVELALANAMPTDLICATGSIFIVAEVMEYMSKRANLEGD
ncbi:MAG: bifunctional folylpolyglutamate synthase/dihydrofolate synthase [Dehalococcoidales bacterium]